MLNSTGYLILNEMVDEYLDNPTAENAVALSEWFTIFKTEFKGLIN